MQKEVLKNGLKVIFERRPGRSVVIQVMVKTGSNNESKSERGLSHFLEHVLFEGTAKRPSTLEISNEIEKIGGEFNAYTTNERTCFYIKVLKKHFQNAVDVLSDILLNSLFLESNIAKEKKVVLKEIDMVHDDPKFYQWVLFQKNLFKKHPCRIPTYGDKKIIKNATRAKILNYFRKHYIANNMIISVVGDVPLWKKHLENAFTLRKDKKIKKPVIYEPAADNNVVCKEKKNVANTYIVLGFKTVPRTQNDSYALEVINGILGRGQSGRIFTEIRSKRGLAYDVGTQHIAEVSFGYFAVYATINKKNIQLVNELILKELKKLRKTGSKDIKEAKDFIEGDYLLELENSQKVADQLLFWEHVKDARLMKEFIRNVKKVTTRDIKRVVDKYFNNYTMVVLEGKK